MPTLRAREGCPRGPALTGGFPWSMLSLTRPYARRAPVPATAGPPFGVGGVHSRGPRRRGRPCHPPRSAVPRGSGAPGGRGRAPPRAATLTQERTGPTADGGSPRRAPRPPPRREGAPTPRRPWRAPEVRPPPAAPAGGAVEVPRVATRPRARAADPPREDGDGRREPRVRASPACRRGGLAYGGRAASKTCHGGTKGRRYGGPGSSLRVGPGEPPSGRTPRGGPAVRARPGAPSSPADKDGGRDGPWGTVAIRRGWGVGAGATPHAGAGRRGRVRPPRPTAGARRRLRQARPHGVGRAGLVGTPAGLRVTESQMFGWQDATMPRSFANTDGMAVAPGSSSYWDGSVRWVYREGGPAGPSRAPRGPRRRAARRARPSGPSPAADGAPSRPSRAPVRGTGGRCPPWVARRRQRGAPRRWPRGGAAGGGGGGPRAGPGSPTAWNAPVVRPSPHTPPAPGPGGTGEPGGRGA